MEVGNDSEQGERGDNVWLSYRRLNIKGEWWVWDKEEEKTRLKTRKVR